MSKEKKKRPDTQSMFECLKKNETTDILENQLEEYLSQMIILNLIFNKKKNQGLDSFYKTLEKDDEIPLDLSYLTESSHSDIREENSGSDFSEIFCQPVIPVEENTQTPSIQSTQNVLTETVNETFIWKIQLFVLKSTLYLCTNCHVDFSLNQQTQKTRGHIYITAPKSVCD